MELKVVARIGFHPPDGWSLADVKAALLYADEVAVDFPPWMLVNEPKDGRCGFIIPGALGVTGGLSMDITAPTAFIADVTRLLGSASVTIVAHELRDLRSVRPTRVGARHNWLAKVPAGYIPMWGEHVPASVATFPASGFAGPTRELLPRPADVAELALAGKLLAELPAFPTLR